FAGETELSRRRAGSNGDVPGSEHIFADLHRIRRDKSRNAVEWRDSRAAKALFFAGRHRISERTFEPLQFSPVDVYVIRAHAFASQAMAEVNRLSGGDEHLLGVASAQLARSSEWPRIGDSDLPPRGAAFESHSCRG